MTVAEDVIITEEAQVGSFEAEEVQLQEEGRAAPRRKVLVADLEATEVQHQERVVWTKKFTSAPRREGGFTSDRPRTEGSSDRAPRRSKR
jgi:ATP-dependent RNA helicase DeaD